MKKVKLEVRKNNEIAHNLYKKFGYVYLDEASDTSIHMIKNIVAAQDTPSIVKIFKKLVLQAYGEKSPDGKRFIKVDENGQPLSRKFAETEAYSNLFMELATDADAAAKFVRGIVPGDIDISDVDPNEMPAGVAEMLKQTAPAPTNVKPIEP